MAHVLLDPGTEHSLQWVVFLDAGGECWTYRNEDVRLAPNETMGRKGPVADDIHAGWASRAPVTAEHTLMGDALGDPFGTRGR